MDLLRIGGALANCGILMWIFSGIYLTFHHIKIKTGGAGFSDTGLRIARCLFHEIKPFYFVLVAVRAIWLTSDGPEAWDAFIVVMDIFNWRWYRDCDKDDDDRWKRRKEKLLEKVSVVGGRLVVSPT